MIEIAGIGIASAFLAGLVSFLSPCVLPMVPGYVSYVAGKSLEEVRTVQSFRSRLEILSLSGSFVVGFSLVFIALGAGATAVGRYLLLYRYEANLVAGFIIVLCGLQLMGLLRLNWLSRDWRLNLDAARGTPLGSFLLGMAFAFGWTPCIGPILGAILTVSATTLNVEQGIALLSIYSLGLAIPFLLVAAFTQSFMGRLRRLGSMGAILHKVSGGLLAVVGVAMMTGYLNSVGTWLLDAFPFFQELII